MGNKVSEHDEALGFRRYEHVERYGTTEVEGIELGKCFVFPKLDGTNASMWLHEDKIMCGSRNRVLTEDNDNAGFCKWVNNVGNIKKFKAYFKKYPHDILYGEWLVPHTLKHYRESAWRDFYVFDVYDGDGKWYTPFEGYIDSLIIHDINYIELTAIIYKPSYEQLVKVMKNNFYLIKDGQPCGEGIIIKNYEYENKYGRYAAAKMVANEFKEKHTHTMGATKMNGPDTIEQWAIDKYLTKTMINKTYDKVRMDNDQVWESKLVHKLLGLVWYDFVQEEIWKIIKGRKWPIINFKTLQYMCNIKVKEVLTDKGVF